MNQTVNKDVLIEILVQENQELKKMHAEYRNASLDYTATLKQIQAQFSQNEETINKLKSVYEDKIRVLECLAEARNKEIEELQNRIKELEAVPANPAQ